MALLFVVYAFVGPWLPGFLAHGGETFIKLVDQQLFTTQGIFGVPTIVSATFIFLFIVFGNVMDYGGLLRFFTDGSLAVAGSSRGGAGKVAVISSGLTGTVNGSAIANAVSIGNFTIPLMIRAGYRREFAAGVEACSSMGGQLAPPVMGAAAFIMAETLQMSYSSIAIAATIPGVLYYVALGAMVHFEALRRGLPVTPRSELPRLGRGAEARPPPAHRARAARVVPVRGPLADVRRLLGAGRRLHRCRGSARTRASAPRRSWPR